MVEAPEADTMDEAGHKATQPQWLKDYAAARTIAQREGLTWSDALRATFNSPSKPDGDPVVSSPKPKWLLDYERREADQKQDQAASRNPR